MTDPTAACASPPPASAAAAASTTATTSGTATHTCCIQGQLVQVRTVSRRLAFADVLVATNDNGNDVGNDEGDGNGNGKQGNIVDVNNGHITEDGRNNTEFVEVVLKTWDLPDSISNIRDALRGCKLGDTVLLEGSFEKEEDNKNNANESDKDNREHENADKNSSRPNAPRHSTRAHRTFKCTALPKVMNAYDGDRPFEPVLTMHLCHPVSSSSSSLNPPPPPPSLLHPRNDDDNDGKKEETTKLCKFYVSTKRCPRTPNCPYVHTDDKELRRVWFEEKREAALRREREMVAGPPSSSSHNGGGGAGGVLAKKSKRAAVFADFLCDKFDLLSSSSSSDPSSSSVSSSSTVPPLVVLDVAGGRGDLCYELAALRGIPCISVDPRGRKLNKRQRKFLKKQQKRRLVAEEEEKKDGDGIREDGGMEDGAEAVAVKVRAAVDGEEDGSLLAASWGEHISELFHADFFDNKEQNKERARLLQRIGLIVGLHPDEATEHIVDCALANGIPFAVTPCCVFPRWDDDHDGGGNTSKKTNTITTLSFREWCDHLEKKDDRIQREYMDVEGKNLVLYLKKDV